GGAGLHQCATRGTACWFGLVVCCVCHLSPAKAAVQAGCAWHLYVNASVLCCRGNYPNTCSVARFVGGACSRGVGGVCAPTAAAVKRPRGGAAIAAAFTGGVGAG